MQKYIVASRINVAPGAGVATLTAVRTIGAGNGGNQIGGLNTAGEFRNKARAEIVFGQLMQEDIGVEEFSTRIKKVGKLAGMTPEQQREQFICGLNPMNQYNIRMMAKFEDTQENITRALAEAEKFTLSQRNAPSSLPVFPAANPYIDTNKLGMTKTEIVDLIKTAMTFSESQTAQQNADLQSTIKSLQETMSRATKTLDNSKKSSKKRAKDNAINRFLSDLLRKNSGKHPADEYDHDSIEDISDSLAGLTLNSVIKTAVKQETIRKVLQSELKLIFPDYFSQDSIKANIPNQAPLIQEKIESQSNTSLITKVLKY
ncbi:10192_t:CDS:2 [Racocetra fulgida]|uniref:10192_t:CDS:1 n=1 Tax=Racocetra fulgida TaxID=60492 RepID=A0A9N8ZQN8_9GLOM|nr:10192_t:CDS:2 [Racocetra fulgida]